MEGWRKEFDLELEARYRKWLEKIDEPKARRAAKLKAAHDTLVERKKRGISTVLK